MIEETGLVIRTEGNFAWVQTQRKTVCGQCSASKGCGTSVVAQWYEGKRNDIRVINSIGAEANERVVLGLREDALVRGSFIVYMMPLVFMFGLWGIASALFPKWGIEFTDGVQVVTAIAGLAIGFIWLRYFSNRIALNANYQAVILRKASETVQFVSPLSRV